MLLHKLLSSECASFDIRLIVYHSLSCAELVQYCDLQFVYIILLSYIKEKRVQKVNDLAIFSDFGPEAWEWQTQYIV